MLEVLLSALYGAIISIVQVRKLRHKKCNDEKSHSYYEAEFVCYRAHIFEQHIESFVCNFTKILNHLNYKSGKHNYI